MRRYWEEQRPRPVLNASLALRLLCGVGMLALVAMLVVRMGEPELWRWMAGDNGRSATAAVDESSRPIPEATGPTDQDPDQTAIAREEFQVLTDGALKLQQPEMEPYYRLVAWSKNQPFERMRRRGRDDLLYTHFHDEPDKYRGRLVTMELDVRRAIDAGVGRNGEKLTELWGFTPESWGRPFVAIVIDYPKDMPLGPSVREQVGFAGYFLKLQGYEPAESRPGDPPASAPLLIGRIERRPEAALRTDDSTEWAIGLTLLAVAALAVGATFVYARLKSKTRPILSNVTISATGEAISIEEWLDDVGRAERPAHRSDDAEDEHIRREDQNPE